MAEGITGHTDPETGEYIESRFQYEPVAPPDRSGMGGLNQDFVEWEMKNRPVAEAMKAVDAAIQYQGLRGYQEALKNGEPAEKAMAKFGPMIFRSHPQALGPSVRALTPPPNAVFNPATNGIPANWSLPGHLPKQTRAPDKPVIRSANKGIYSFDPVTGERKTLLEPPPSKPIIHSANKGIYSFDPVTGERKTLLEPPPSKPIAEPRPYTITTSATGRDPGVSQRLTAAEYGVRPPDSATQKLMDDYDALKAKIAASDLKAGPDWAWNPATDRRDQAAALKVKIARAGFDADTGKRILAPKTQAAPVAAQPAASPVSPSPRYPTATNKKTGERMIFKEGKWQSLQP
jgi:hypothetical protein